MRNGAKKSAKLNVGAGDLSARWNQPLALDIHSRSIRHQTQWQPERSCSGNGPQLE